MKYYEDAKNANPYQNIGWKLINEIIPESQIQKFSTTKEQDKVNLMRIMFLNSQKLKEEKAIEDE